MENKIEIGTQYTARNIRKDICTVIDIYKTYNNAGELVKIAYLCNHYFQGFKVNHIECGTTILMCGIKAKREAA